MPETDYPSRETAQALIAALQGDDWETLRDLERLTGVRCFSYTAECCYMVYGCPELEAGNVNRRLMEVFMRPASQKAPAATQEGPAGCTKGVPGMRP